MSLYTSYTIVDSPLTEELQPFIRIRKRDLGGDPIQQRMLVIMAFVLLVVTAFSLIAARNRYSVATPGFISSDRPPGETAEEVRTLELGELSPVFSKEVLHWQADILKWAAIYEIHPDIVATIMQIESCGDPGAVSSAGAQGLFQVMPFHFAEGEDMLDPETNARRGLSYYRQQLKETGGDVYLSFAGYNGGSAASSSGWDYWAAETQRYFVWSQGIFNDAQAGLQSSPTLQRWMEAGGASLCQQASNRLGLE